MAGTGLQMDWTGVVYTPTSGSPITITEVTDVAPKDGGQMERFYGDAAKYATAGRNVHLTATVKITSGNIGVLRTIPLNTLGTLTFTHNDYLNGSGSGAVVYTLINAQRVEIEDSGGNNKFGMGSVAFEGLSADGITSPLSSTQNS